MKSKNADYGWDIDMTIWRAIRVFYWRAIKHETWRAIAFMWAETYPDYKGLELKGNQYFGMSVLDCAAIKLGLRSYVSWPLN